MHALTVTSATVPVGGRGNRGVLASMCLCLILVVASVSAVNLALPDLAVDLNASSAALIWIADAYTVALAALVLPCGALGDRMGRRNVLLVGAVVFGVGALAAVWAGGTGALIGWRVVMGVGAAMIMPGTLSTITAVLPAEQHARGVAVWSGFAAAGAIVGMLAAGALLEFWGWRSIFVASAVGAALAAVTAATLAPNTRAGGSVRPDLPGALTSAAGIGTLVYALIQGHDAGWAAPDVVGSLVVSVLSFGGYAVLGLRRDEPLLDPRLFGIAGFRVGTVTIVVQFMAIFGFFFVGLQYLQLILRYTPMRSAVALIPVAAVVVPVSLLTPAIVRRVGLKAVLVAGLAILGAGMLALSWLTVSSGYWPFLGGLIVCGFGIGMLSPSATAVIVGSLAREKQGVASAVNDATREIGSAVGIAVMGSTFTSHYREHLPADVGRLCSGAATAVQHSAASGLAVAARLGPLGAPLARAVRGAFIEGLAASLTAAAVVLFVTAAVCCAWRTVPSAD